MGKSKLRGNGQGSVYKRGDKWVGEVRQARPYFRKRKGSFKTKTAALEWVNSFDIEAAIKAQNRKLTEIEQRTAERQLTTFKQLYDEFIVTHQRSKSTINCYNAAVKYYADIYDVPFREVQIEDLQECINDCPHGKRTKENMRAVATLMYKYAIPRRGLTYDSINLASYLKSYDTSPSQAKAALPTNALPQIEAAIGVVPYAEHIFCLCYLGFRLSAFLALRVEDYNTKEKCLTGGIKTEAGRNRIVTISPKIQRYIDASVSGRKSGALFTDTEGNPLRYTYFKDYCFYPALDAIGIDNPVVTVNGYKMHKYTPHSCRHTFATLLKSAVGADKDKLELMGHTSSDMLRYYQEVNYSDLRAITNQL